MAKKTNKVSGRKPKSPKQAKAPKAQKAAAPEAKMTPKQAFDGFNPKGRTPWQEYCKAQGPNIGRRLGLNETGMAIDASGNQGQIISSIDKHIDGFNKASERWEATAEYGRQHFNDDGFLHRTCVTRLDDDALAKLVVQASEELCQRAAMAGSEATLGRKIDTKQSAALVDGIQVWLGQRVESITANKREQAYKVVNAAVKGDAPTLEAKSA